VESDILKDFIDRISSGKKIITYENGTTETVTIENAEDATVEGTPINRANLMALQGFQPATIEYKNGEQIITYSNNHQLRTKVEGNVITEIFIGEKTITKITTIDYENKSRQVVVE
jgi:hypothetical protein